MEIKRWTHSCFYISTNIFLYFIFSFDECLRGNLKMQTIAVCFPFYLKAKASGVNTSLQGELWSPKKPYPEKQVHPHRCDCQCQKWWENECTLHFTINTVLPALSLKPAAYVKYVFDGAHNETDMSAFFLGNMRKGKALIWQMWIDCGLCIFSGWKGWTWILMQSLQSTVNPRICTQTSHFLAYTAFYVLNYK